jgi:hypothetical protein
MFLLIPAEGVVAKNSISTARMRWQIDRTALEPG